MRPRTLFMTLCVLLTPIWLPSGHAEPESTWKLEERVPASTLALLALEDIGTWEARFKQTAMGQLFEEPEMRAFSDPLQKELEAMVEDPSGPLGEVPFLEDIIKQVAGLHGQVAVALLDIDLEGDMPTIVASLDFGPRLPEFVTFVNRLKADLGEDGEAIQTFERDGRTWWQLDSGGPVISATTVDTAFVLGTDPEVVSNVVAGPRAGSLGSTPAFKSARSRTGGDALGVFLYMNAPKLVDKLGDEMDSQTRAIANALGLDTVTGIAYGMAFKGDGFLDTFVIETPDAEHGLATHEMFEPLRQEALAMVPANAFYYAESSLRFDQLMPTVRKILAEVDGDMLRDLDEVMEHVRAEIGVDLEKELPPLLANRSAFYAAFPDTGGLFPEMAMLFKVRDPAAIEPFMTRVMNGVAGSLTESGEVIASSRTLDYHGHTLHLFEMQGARGDDIVPMTPSWAVVGDWLVVTAVPYTLKDFILRRELEGDAFKSLAGEEDFKSVMKHKPENAGVVYYMDTQALMSPKPWYTVSTGD